MKKGYKIYTALYAFKIFATKKIVARTHKEAEIIAINNTPNHHQFERVNIK